MTTAKRMTEHSSYGPSVVNGAIDAALRSEPPAAGATLSGWVALGEWIKPGGERMLVLIGNPEASPLQMKAYLHSGLLNMVWKACGDR